MKKNEFIRRYGVEAYEKQLECVRIWRRKNRHQVEVPNILMKDISGYENYAITVDGRVYSKKRGIFLQPTKDRIGYLTITLSKNGKQKKFLIHRLVAEAFLPNPDNLPCVNHKDEDKTNNFVWVNEDGSVDPQKSNLERCDQKYNVNYGNAQIKRIEARRRNGNLIDIPVELIDNAGYVLDQFDSIRQAAFAIGKKYGTLHYHIKNKNFYDATIFKIVRQII